MPTNVEIPDGNNVTQGTKADSAATDSTSSWSMTALLKGLYAKLAGTITELNSAAILAAIQALNPSRTQVTGSTTISAAQSGTASLAGTTGKTTYMTGFTVIAGAVAAEVEGNVTITGLIGGTANYRLIETVSAGGVINVQFSSGIAASATNTPITVNVPAITNGGAVTVAMTGYQQ